MFGCSNFVELRTLVCVQSTLSAARTEVSQRRAPRTRSSRAGRELFCARFQSGRPARSSPGAARRRGPGPASERPEMIVDPLQHPTHEARAITTVTRDKHTGPDAAVYLSPGASAFRFAHLHLFQTGNARRCLRRRCAEIWFSQNPLLPARDRPKSPKSRVTVPNINTPASTQNALAAPDCHPRSQQEANTSPAFFLDFLGRRKSSTDTHRAASRRLM